MFTKRASRAPASLALLRRCLHVRPGAHTAHREMEVASGGAGRPRLAAHHHAGCKAVGGAVGAPLRRRASQESRVGPRSGQAKERFWSWRVQRPCSKSTRSVPSIPRSAGNPEAQRRGAAAARPQTHPQPCARYRLAAQQVLIDFVLSRVFSHLDQVLAVSMRTLLRTVVGLPRNPWWRSSDASSGRDGSRIESGMTAGVRARRPISVPHTRVSRPTHHWPHTTPATPSTAHSPSWWSLPSSTSKTAC